jgi:hypothetical protein
MSEAKSLSMFAPKLPFPTLTPAPVHIQVRFSAKLDGVCYASIVSGGVLCRMGGFSTDFPRNLICMRGILFNVTLLSVSDSGVNPLKSVVVPRHIRQIDQTGVPLTNSSSKSLECFPFEFQSAPTDIAAGAFCFSESD